MSNRDDFETDDDDVTFVFERLDVPHGPGRTIITTLPRDCYSAAFRRLNAQFPVELVSFDPRRADHPDRMAEAAALRELLHAARLSRRTG
jgi:hypothetical protein